MDTLPEEMLCSILRYVSYTDLMKCRLVSRNLKSAASIVTRRRHVHLRSEWGPPNFEEMMCRFKELGDQLPWSACTINIKNAKRTLKYSGDSLSPDMIRRFLNAFGTQIRKVTLEGDRTAFLLEFFNGTPNLEVLVIGLRTIWKLSPQQEAWQHIVESGKDCTINLKKLKALEVLEINNTHTIVKIMDFLFSRMSLQHLQYLHFPIRHTDNLGLIDSLLELRQLTSIPCISIQYADVSCNNLDMFERLADSRLRVTEFRLDYVPMPSFTIRGPEFFQPLEKFLTVNSGHLTYLKIGDNLLADRSFVQNYTLTLPPLPNLKTLELDRFGAPPEHPYYPVPVLLSLTPFQRNQFENLEKLVVVMKAGHDVGSLFSALTIHFESVTELKIYEYGPVEHPSSTNIDWNRILPNVKKVEAHGVSKESLRNILKMRKVQHLVVTAAYSDPGPVVDRFKCDVDSSIIYSAYPDNSKTVTVIVIRSNSTTKEEEQTVRHVTVKDLPSFLLLTDLKTLAIDFRNCDSICKTDPSVHLKLLQLPSLDCLTLRGVKISEECRDKLIAHHKKFLHEYTLKGDGRSTRTNILD